MRRWPSGLVLAVMLAATASATAPVMLQGASLDWSAGTAGGPLVILAGVGDETPMLALTAGHLELDWDETNTYAQTLDGSYFSLLSEPGHSQADSATLRVGEARPGWVAYAFPLGPSLAESDCGSVQPTQDATRTAPIMVKPQRTAPSAQTAGAVEVRATTDCPQPTFHLRGDFLVVLWGLDGELTTPDGTTSFQSGHYDTTSARQYFITARGADLTFQGPASSPGSLYTAGLDVAADPLRLHDARGAVAGHEVDVSLAVLRGSGLTARVERQGATLSLSAEHAARVELDGSAVALTDRPTISPWIWAAVGIVVAVTAALWWRAVDPNRIRIRIETARQRGKDGLVVGLASRLLNRSPHDTELLTVRAEAWLNLQHGRGALEDAQRILETRHSRAARAVAAVLACRASLLLHQTDEATRFLGLAYEEDPATASAAMALFPDVARLMGPPVGYS